MNSASELPIAYSVSEVARLVGISRSKVYQLLGAGRLPSFKIGDRRLVRRSAIEAFLASLESAADNSSCARRDGHRGEVAGSDVLADAAGKRP